MDALSNALDYVIYADDIVLADPAAALPHLEGITALFDSIAAFLESIADRILAVGGATADPTTGTGPAAAYDTEPDDIARSDQSTAGGEGSGRDAGSPN